MSEQEIQETKLTVVDQNLDNEEDLEVYEPGSVEELISYLKRNFNALNEENIVTRKKAIINIEQRLKEEEYRISGMISQQIMLKFNKQLLKTFADKAEKCREYSIRIFKELITRCDDMTQFLPYIFSVVTERVNCHDLEGIQHLPEVMKPPPGQKPKRMIKLVETSEEVRIQLCELLYDIICQCVNNELVPFLDDICNILRALAMDPSGDIQREACKTIGAFCRNNTEMLLHFTEILARSILLPLISKKSKVRIAALDALGAILYCGIWKYNAFVFENLVGFRDPNSVPIKDFYEATHNINYFATLINDSKVQVREMFLRCAGDWITELEDKYDHHPRLIPYVLSGLFDPHPEIRSMCFEILQDAGSMEEKDKEKEVLEKKQYGIDQEWTQGGKLSNLSTCEYVPERPNLGARLLVRSHVRKWWGALYKEIKDVNPESRLRASRLLLIGVSFTEDYMTQFLDDFTRTLLWYTTEKNVEEKEVSDNISRCFELIGRYCYHTSFMHLIVSGLKGEFSQNDDYIRACIKTFACLLKGSLEATLKENGLTKPKMEFMEQIIDIIQEYNFLEFLSSNNFQESAILFKNLVSMLFEYANHRQLQDLNSKGLNFMNKIGFVTNYISLFEKTYILTQSYSQETTNSILDHLKPQSNQLFEIHNQLLSLEDNPCTLLNQFYQEIKEENYLTFNSYQWKQLIGSLLYVIFNFDKQFSKEYKQQALELIQNHFNLICDTIMTTNNPEISDYLAKFSLMILSAITDKIIENQDLISVLYKQCMDLIGQVFYWLTKTEKKLNPKITANFQVLFNQASKSCFAKQNIPLFNQIIENEKDKQDNFKGFSQFLYQIPFNFRRYFKSQSLSIVQITNTVVSQFLVPLFQKNLDLLEKLYVMVPKKVYKKQPKYGETIQLGGDKKEEEQKSIKDENNPEQNDNQNQEQEEEIKDSKNTEQKEKEDEVKQSQQQQEEKQEEVTLEKIYVVPLLFDFALNRVEQLGDQPSQKLVDNSFSGLKELVKLIPIYEKTYLKGEDCLIADYEKFVSKIIRYTVDERDAELKKEFISMLVCLAGSTPFNFKNEITFSEDHRQFNRVKLLQDVLKQI